jgi:putative transposase
MSRLRRPFLCDRFFFVTVKLLPCRAKLQAKDFARIAVSLSRMRQKHGFSLTAWVLLPDHRHAIFYPPYPLTISRLFQAVKVSSTIAVNLHRRERGELWQERFFDHALRTVRDYHDKVEYIHLNPVKRGLVRKPEDWKWSSMAEYAGVSAEEQERRCGLRIDRVSLPTDLRTRI